MAFQAVSGYNNLPNGHFSPEIYSKKAQIAFRKSSVVQGITNNDYYGEISEQGDTVHIIKEPQLSVGPYARGQQIQVQDLDDEEFTLTVDQSNYFAFKVDDLEKKQAHHNWESMASDNAGYQLRDAFDKNVLNYMTANVESDMTLGTNASPVGIDVGGGGDYTPLQAMNRIKRYLDQENVPMEDRWFVADPVFWELMQDEDSKLMDVDYSHDNDSILRNGQVTRRSIRGFRVLMSNNLPIVGTGPTATSGSNYGWILAGHQSAVATAEQIRKTESHRDQNSFADIVRGLHIFGRKLLRPESLVAIRYQSV